jgi:hypothetical protein
MYKMSADFRKAKTDARKLRDRLEREAEKLEMRMDEASKLDTVAGQSKWAKLAVEWEDKAREASAAQRDYAALIEQEKEDRRYAD